MAATGATVLISLSDLHLPDIERRVRSGRRSALAKACGAVSGLRIHDAMAGWGTDGLVLAGLGCNVHMSECNAEVYAVMAERAANGAPRSRVSWALEDARCRWHQATPFDVVYLDPMFGRHPKTALPAKSMQLLAALADPVASHDLVQLIEQARGVAGDRVVVKRRASAPPAVRPDWSIEARSVRFDVYRALAAAGRSRS